MKIQEMRSGILHLNKKMEDEWTENNSEVQMSGGWDPGSEALRSTLEDCELDRACWSVISFGRIETKSLTYEQASERLSRLDADGIAGLCIVTDEASERL